MHQLLKPPTSHIIVRKRKAEAVKPKINFIQTYRDNVQIRVKDKTDRVIDKLIQ